MKTEYVVKVNRMAESNGRVTYFVVMERADEQHLPMLKRTRVECAHGSERYQMEYEAARYRAFFAGNDTLDVDILAYNEETYPNE